MHVNVNVDVVAEIWWVEKILHQEGAMPAMQPCIGGGNVSAELTARGQSTGCTIV